MLIQLLLPQFRHDIKISFKDLADKDWQMKEWFKYAGYDYNFDNYFSNTVLKDHELHDKDLIEEHVGEIFYDAKEAKIVNEFCYSIVKMFDEVSPEQSLYEHPEWPKVWQGAKEIYEMMAENDKKYGFGDCLSAFNNSNYDEWCKRFDGET